MKPLRLALPLTLAALLISGAALASAVMVTEGRVMRYSTPNLTYELGTYAPSSVGQAGLNANDAGFATWEAVSCSALNFTKLGSTSVTSVLPTGAEPNGHNELIFSQYGAWPFDSNTLGVTVPLGLTDGRIIESDIAYSPSVDWSTSSNAPWGYMDIQGVATHEIGHFFGQHHVLEGYFDQWDPPTMAPYTQQGYEQRSLLQDDINGVCFLYPSGSSYTCYSDSQCPYIIDQYSNGQEYYSGQFSCSGNACVSGQVQDGYKQYGQDCGQTSECQAPLFCQQTATGSVCSQDCNPEANNCPDDDNCVAYPDMPTIGVCFPVIEKAEGELCSSGYECDTGLCFPDPNDGPDRCRYSCKVSQQNCAGGYTCISYTGIDYGGCIPDGLLGPPKKGVGEACAAHDDCESAACVWGECRDACDGPNDGSCPWGLTCVFEGGVYGCLEVKAALGESCAWHGECESGVCGQGVCLRGCGSDGDCGGGEVCAAFSDSKMGCVPDETPAGKADGEGCAYGTECQSGACVALPGTEWSYCRSACVPPGGSCPAGQECVDYGPGQGGVCMPQKHSEGDYCSNNDDCTTGICHTTEQGQLQCVAPCRSYDPTCPVGEQCVADATFGDLCLPDPNATTGTEPDGGPCSADAQCISGLCHQGACRARCNVFSSACGGGLVCFPFSDGNQGACVPVGGVATGGACAQDLDCLSAFCAHLGDSAYCVQPCDRGAPACPSPESCIPVGSYAILGVCWDTGGGGDGGDGGDGEDGGFRGGGGEGGIAFCALGGFQGAPGLGPLWLLGVVIGLAARRRLVG